MTKEISQSKTDCNSEFDICFKYYEKAIEGRNLHYQNYNSWVNLYSIFTGAIFVAYYTILEKATSTSFIVILLQFLGLITSICWFSSVRGYYHWIISWIGVVHDYEKKLAELSEKENKYFVYAVLKDVDKKFYHKNLSTQRITVIFVFCVIIAWILLLIKSFFNFIKIYLSIPKILLDASVLEIILRIVLFIICIVLIVFIWRKINKQSSNSKGMVKDIFGIEKW